MRPDLLPPPRPRPLSPVLAHRGAAVLVAATAASAASASAWPDALAWNLLFGFVSGLLGFGLAAAAARAPEHPVRRSVLIGAGVGGGVGLVVFVLFLALAAREPNVPDTALVGAAVVAFSVSAAIAGVAAGLVLGLLSASLLGLPEQACDADDERRVRLAGWLVLAGGASAWAAGRGGSPAPMAAHLLVLGAGGVAAAVALARDGARLRWLGRVLAGHPLWTLIDASSDPSRDLPAYVALDPPPDEALLARREEPEQAPFRSSARLIPAAFIDAGARRTRARLRRRFAFAAATLLAAAAATTAAIHGLLTAPPPPPPPRPPDARASQQPHRVDVGGPAASVVMGHDAACAVRRDGEVWCWGKNRGRFPGLLAHLDAPTRVPHLPFARSLALGYRHACSLHQGGVVRCWGEDRRQLGHLARKRSDQPVIVEGAGEARALAAHHNTTCALRTDGTVWCWGRVVGEPCPDDECGAWATPERISGFTRIEEIALGKAVPGLTAMDKRYGPNLYARDAHGSLLWLGQHVDLPESPAFDAEVQSLAVTEAGCVLLARGAPRCFGPLGWLDPSYQRGLRAIEALAGSEQVVIGHELTCALGADRLVRCAGNNLAGSLGDRTTVSRSELRPVLGVDDVASVAADRSAACAVRRDGAVWCWGELGD